MLSPPSLLTPTGETVFWKNAEVWWSLWLTVTANTFLFMFDIGVTGLTGGEAARATLITESWHVDLFFFFSVSHTQVRCVWEQSRVPYVNQVDQKCLHSVSKCLQGNSQAQLFSKHEYGFVRVRRYNRRLQRHLHSARLHHWSGIRGLHWSNSGKMAFMLQTRGCFTTLIRSNTPWH